MTKFNLTRLKYFAVLTVLCLGMQFKSFAGGFPVRPGSLMVSTSFNYFVATKGWDSTKRLAPFPLGGKFTSQLYSTYIQLGISKRWAFIGTFPYVINDYHQLGFSNHAQGLTDIELGLKYYLFNINYTYYFSLQGNYIQPTYTDLNLGYAEKGLELKASFAGSGTVIGKHYFFNVEDGIRQYYGDQGPVQNRYNATFGLSLDKKNKHSINLSIGGFYSTSSFTQTFANQSLNKNFAFTQVSVSYGYSFSKVVSVFLTAGTFVAGRNTGDGTSGSIAINIKPFRGI